MLARLTIALFVILLLAFLLFTLFCLLFILIWNLNFPQGCLRIHTKLLMAIQLSTPLLSVDSSCKAMELEAEVRNSLRRQFKDNLYAKPII
eukprot:6488711-Amphidinium_carterae.4